MQKTARIESPFGFLSAGKLKIIACIAMFIDHLGLMIFPSVYAFRAIGRLAFPIFAYFIAEGCHYTKRKVRRFLLLLGFGLSYLLVYYIFAAELYASIFLTFSVSVLVIYILDFVKRSAFSDFNCVNLTLSLLLLAGVLIGAYFLFVKVEFDYGFYGMLVPVLVSLFDFKDIQVPSYLRFLDTYYMRLILLCVGLLLVCSDSYVWTAEIFSISVPHYCFYFAAPILLLFYNGKVGNKKLKYAFYIFYPAHIVFITAISIIISIF